jgi:hypothetical protein
MGGETERWRSQAAQTDHMIKPLNVNPLLLTTTDYHSHDLQLANSFDYSSKNSDLTMLKTAERDQFHVSGYDPTEQLGDLSWPTVLPATTSIFDTTPFTGGYFPQPSTDLDYNSEYSFTESDSFTNHPGSFSTISTTHDSLQLDQGEQRIEEAPIRNQAGIYFSPRIEKYVKAKPPALHEATDNLIKIRKARSKKSGQSRINALEEAFRSYSNSPSFRGFKELMDEAMSYGELHANTKNAFFLNTPLEPRESFGSREMIGLSSQSDDISTVSNPRDQQDTLRTSRTSETISDVFSQRGGTRPQFTCTFHSCEQTFSAYSDWKRHEENQDHYPQERFMCLRCLIPDNVQIENTFCEICLYRFSITDDLEAHYRVCLPTQDNPKSTFTRKYHLNNHLRRQHSVGMVKANELSSHWKYTLINSWPRECHICHATFTTWDERMKHIAKHFHKGEDRPPGFSQDRKDDDSDQDDDDNDDNGPPRKRFRGSAKIKGSKNETKSQKQATAAHRPDPTSVPYLNSRIDSTSNLYTYHCHHHRPESELKGPGSLRDNVNTQAHKCCHNLAPLSGYKESQKRLALPSECLNWNRLFMLERYLKDADEGMPSSMNWSDISKSNNFTVYAPSHPGVTPPPLGLPLPPREHRKASERAVRIKATFKSEQLKAAMEYLAQHVRALPNGVFWFNSSIEQDVKDSFWDIAIRAIQASPKDNPTVLHVCDSWWRQEGATIAPTPTIDCTYLVIAAYQEADVVHLEWTLDRALEKLDTLQHEVQDLHSLQALFHLYLAKSQPIPSKTQILQQKFAAQIYTASTQQFINFLIRYKRPFNRRLTTKTLAVFHEIENTQRNSSDPWMQTYLEKECLKRRLLYLKKLESRNLSVRILPAIVEIKIS